MVYFFLWNKFILRCLIILTEWWDWSRWSTNLTCTVCYGLLLPFVLLVYFLWMQTFSSFLQALTRARVPIVKLMDPVTGISCDICINNLLAVVNTKLLRDYAQIDVRLQQLAFIVKHWAKSRGVNVTYQGTLSSYA